MPRRKGDLNFKKRSDFGKQRKFYAGKKVKKKVRRKGKLIPYEKVHKDGDPYKIWYWEIKPMTKSGLKNWDKKLRSRVHKKTFHFGIRVDVDESDLCSKEAVENLTLEVVGYEGDFYMMMWGKSKNLYHCSPFKLCHLKIEETSEGLICRMVKNFRLWRFKFYK